MSEKDRIDAFPALIQNIFLITPVISTTFASAQTFLRDIKHPGTLGTLIVDEAGQAQPQMAVGALMRCRRAIIVGDPKQIEPVVTEETDMIKSLITSDLLTPYQDKKISVQGFADYINSYGTFSEKMKKKSGLDVPLLSIGVV
ncbi:AAA domain-containing protein [Niallia circulans]|uniref:AAA domain-containing protein n=1 Tax=Niallia circulans TaxID=1397 RepID=UPI0013DE052B|nr:AAA domain-containing protein [Niallia circulans]